MAEEDEIIDDSLPPANTNTFRLPRDKTLLLTYEVYKTSKETRKLESEKGRTIYSEAFIEDPNLGTLADLCAAALAKLKTTEISPLVKYDPLKLRIHYDSLDVDLPLERCYMITDPYFWRRVVLTKSKDHELAFKSIDEHPWKNHAISMKFVELVEACPAEYWPEEEMTKISLLIKDFVEELYIKKLQSLTDRTFEKHIVTPTESDASTTSESESIDISSDELSESDLIEEVEEEEVAESDHKNSAVRTSTIAQQSMVQPQSESEPPPEKSEEQLQLEHDKLLRRQSRLARNMRRKFLRDAKAKKSAERAERRRRRAAKKMIPDDTLETPKKRRKKKLRIKGVFDLPIEPESDDGEADIADKRNLEKVMRRMQKYNYPPEHCHHIDLSFVRHFENLTKFSIEFLGPDMERNYHTRHFNFSYDDITRLTRGLKSLHSLKVFRLRNSRMNAKKLQLLTKTLKHMEMLEVIDFGYDLLEDDCAYELSALLEFPINIKSIELESNKLGYETILRLGQVLGRYKSTNLEYLGLARNEITDEGLHALCMSILGTPHVKILNITGINITDDGVICCIANKLLRQHAPLKQLIMTAIPMSYEAGIELIKALQTNKDIEYIDCRCCDLDFDMEFEADVIMRRNAYIRNNTYLGDSTKTEMEIMQIVENMKNPIMEKALGKIEENKICLANRPMESQSPLPAESTGIEEELVTDDNSYKKFSFSTRDTFIEEASIESDTKAGDFIYDPNNFDEYQFREHVHRPGPANRYYYFQKVKETW